MCLITMTPDPGVKELMRLAVEGVRRNRRHSGICGQDPSDYPEITEYFVEIGIDSMSLNPDTVLDHHPTCAGGVEKRLSRATKP
jgi:pyruvate,water dikinase